MGGSVREQQNLLLRLTRNGEFAVSQRRRVRANYR